MCIAFMRQMYQRSSHSIQLKTSAYATKWSVPNDRIATRDIQCSNRPVAQTACNWNDM